MPTASYVIGKASSRSDSASAERLKRTGEWETEVAIRQADREPRLAPRTHRVAQYTIADDLNTGILNILA